MGQAVIVLGIETSCDETAVALVGWEGDRPVLLAERVASQTPLHARFGGVVPEIASRAHAESLPPMVEAVLDEAGVLLASVDEIAVTAGPGLIGALLVGVALARALGVAAGKPVRPVHHLEGHLWAPMLAGRLPDVPFLALLASGGHTMLVRVEALGRYQVLGETLDDAAGECLDKIARLIGLGYPGGPAIEKAARKGDPTRFPLPRPMLEKGLNFSFSGLKTAARLAWEQSPQDAEAQRDLAAALQAAVVDVLAEKTAQAARASAVQGVVVAGGVAANEALRARLAEAVPRGIPVFFPPPRWCTDNAAMIALVGLLHRRAGTPIPKHWDASPRWPLVAAR
ncbi:MAG: tRNA (adenosine(37)-N6)-threonylcarbamoyltransferase complex transferase subunit TsaD [Zetaproteobacteria bacterium]|nr:MAG: tRNA (adenosine(37)-N6)-threonylcarbamoyltransferase complex transferase subunit TsaD [Zetaproteobacteria bacterium]